jgi:hypothetical protein
MAGSMEAPWPVFRSQVDWREVQLQAARSMDVRSTGIQLRVDWGKVD